MKKALNSLLLLQKINLYNIYSSDLSLFTKICVDAAEISLFESQKMRLYITRNIEYPLILLYNL